MLLINLKFPSPYGVLFILIASKIGAKVVVATTKFPSPCGVLFILILRLKGDTEKNSKGVSVSLRSIIHSYGKLWKFKLYGDYEVSVSLRSIIHSYFYRK